MNNEINIISDQNINKEYLETLHKNPVFTEIFKEIDDFLLIESVIDSQEENKIIGLIDFASALIAIPLKDGNKRIGAACFLLFLMRNNLLLSANEVPFISNDALASITLFVAASKPEEMETVKGLVISVLNRRNL